MGINNIQGVYKYTERCKHINGRNRSRKPIMTDLQTIQKRKSYGGEKANYIKTKILWKLGESKLCFFRNPLGAKMQTLFFQKSFGG